MNSRRAELMVDFVWVAFAGAYCAVAAGYPPGGRMVPLTIGLVALALGIVHLSGNFIAVLHRLTHGTETALPIERSEATAALWAAALLGGMFVVGAVAAVFLFFLLYFVLLGRRWLLGLGSAIVMSLLTWGLFGQLLGLELPTGFLTSWVLRLF